MKESSRNLDRWLLRRDVQVSICGLFFLFVNEEGYAMLGGGSL